jgi:hypothetical protein
MSYPQIGTFGQRQGTNRVGRVISVCPVGFTSFLVTLCYPDGATQHLPSFVFEAVVRDVTATFADMTAKARRKAFRVIEGGRLADQGRTEGAVHV